MADLEAFNAVLKRWMEDEKRRIEEAKNMSFAAAEIMLFAAAEDMSFAAAEKFRMTQDEKLRIFEASHGHVFGGVESWTPLAEHIRILEEESRRAVQVCKDHAFRAMMHMALATFDRGLAMMHMTLATLHMALDFRPLHPGVQNMWQEYKRILEVATVALNQAKSMLECLGVQNIRQLCKNLMGSATFILDKAKFIFKSLVDWFPCLLKDSSQVLTAQNLVKIAQAIGKGWNILGLSLGLERVQLDHITEDHKSTVMKIYTMLTTWLDENGSEATVWTLYQTIFDCEGVRFNWNKLRSVLSDVCQSGI